MKLRAVSALLRLPAHRLPVARWSSYIVANVPRIITCVMKVPLFFGHHCVVGPLSIVQVCSALIRQVSPISCERGTISPIRSA